MSKLSFYCESAWADSAYKAVVVGMGTVPPTKATFFSLYLQQMPRIYYEMWHR